MKSDSAIQKSEYLKSVILNLSECFEIKLFILHSQSQLDSTTETYSLKRKHNYFIYLLTTLWLPPSNFLFPLLRIMPKEKSNFCMIGTRNVIGYVILQNGKELFSKGV